METNEQGVENSHLMELLLFNLGGAGDPVESLWCIRRRACVKLARCEPNDSTLSASHKPIPKENNHGSKLKKIVYKFCKIRTEKL